MKSGITFDTHVDKWELIRYAEELGYDRAWVPDSEMITSNCYTTLALAEPDTILADPRALENAGLKEVALLPPADFQRKVGSVRRKDNCRSRCGGQYWLLIPNRHFANYSA